jgi:hypothetical protein
MRRKCDSLGGPAESPPSHTCGFFTILLPSEGPQCLPMIMDNGKVDQHGRSGLAMAYRALCLSTDGISRASPCLTVDGSRSGTAFLSKAREANGVRQLDWVNKMFQGVNVPC